MELVYLEVLRISFLLLSSSSITFSIFAEYIK